MPRPSRSEKLAGRRGVFNRRDLEIEQHADVIRPIEITDFVEKNVFMYYKCAVGPIGRRAVARREIVFHAMKVAGRAGRVKALSVAFDGPSVSLVDTFRERLHAIMATQVRITGRFEIQARPGRRDWLVFFWDLCLEADLDRMLNAVATELEGKMYIEPAISLNELTPECSSFFFAIDVLRRRPNN